MRATPIPARPGLAGWPVLLLLATLLPAAAARAADDSQAGTAGDTATAVPSAATPAAADTPPALEDGPPDGMGHRPGHAHASAPDADAEADDAEDGDDPHSAMMMAHHGHCGMEMHGMEMHGMAMHGLDEPREGHAGHGQTHPEEGPAEAPDATLAAIAAPAPPHWLHGIELDEAQQDRIFDILHEVAAAQRKAQRTAERTHHQLSHLGMATDYSESNARKLSDQHAQAIGELTLLRIRTEKRILDVLTPEQRRDAAHQAAREE